jgi:diguanylate cyclase (GGDEF)-like protein
VVITLKNNQRENNFDNKKSNIIILIIIAITLIAIYYNYYTLNQKSVEKNQQSYLNHQKLQTTTIITSINNKLHDLKHHLESVKSMYGEIFEENDSKIYKSVFDSLINSHHNLSSLIYYTKDLNILYEYKSNHGNHQKIKDINSEWINSYLPIMEKNQRDSFIPMIYSDSENQYMGVIIPFYQQNELKSFFISVLDLNSIVNEFIDLANIPDVSEVFVVDRYGSTIYSNRKEDYGKTIFEINRKLSPLLEIYNQFITTKSGSEDYSVDNNGDRIEYLLSWDSLNIESRKLILTISTPKSYIDETLKVVSEEMIILNIIITILMITFIYLFFKLKTKNLIQLKNHFEKIANQKSKEYYQSQKMLTERNLNLQEAYEKLEKTNTKLLDKKWALEQSFSNNQILADRLENIIKLITSIDMTATKSLEDFLIELFDTALKVIPEADYGSIFLYKNDYIKYLKTKGHDMEFLNYMKIPSKAFSQFERSKSIIVEHIENIALPGMSQEKLEQFRKNSLPMKQSITFNLMINDKKIAGISLDIAEKSEKSFDETTIQIMEAFRKISNIFLKIQNYQLELNRKATYDSLTGTYNRRMILQILGQNIKLAKRQHTPVSVCFIDVDKLKYINDHLGHKIGDNLLVNVTKIIRENIREVDSLARIGGDEFLIVFPNCTKEKAEEIWQRILEDFKKFNEENKSYSIEVSHGISQFDMVHIKNVDELITEADEKMYKEKNRKREEENDKP